MGIQKIDMLATDMTVKELAQLSEQGDEIWLMKGEKVLTKIPPEEATKNSSDQRVLGLHAGMIWMADDFDDPLPDEFWLGDKL